MCRSPGLERPPPGRPGGSTLTTRGDASHLTGSELAIDDGGSTTGPTVTRAIGRQPGRP